MQRALAGEFRIPGLPRRRSIAEALRPVARPVFEFGYSLISSLSHDTHTGEAGLCPWSHRSNYMAVGVSKMPVPKPLGKREKSFGARGVKTNNSELESISRLSCSEAFG